MPPDFSKRDPGRSVYCIMPAVAIAADILKASAGEDLTCVKSDESVWS
jgi:hypothetical protein